MQPLLSLSPAAVSGGAKTRKRAAKKHTAKKHTMKKAIAKKHTMKKASAKRRSTMGTRSKTHPGRLNYVTGKRDRDFHRGHHWEKRPQGSRKMRRPYHKRR